MREVGRGLPKMGREPRAGSRGDGRGGQGWRGRVARALSRQSAVARPALRPPPPQTRAGRLGLEPCGVPRGQDLAPSRSLREAGLGQACGPGH